MDSLLNSDLISGGFVLMLLGGLLAYLRFVPNLLWREIKKRLVITVKIDKGDAFYEWVENWLAKQEYARRCRSVHISAFRDSEDQFDINKTESGELTKKAWEIRITPAPGNHFFRYKGRPIWLYKTQEKLKESGRFTGFFESMEITIFSRSLDIAQALLEEIREFNVPKEDRRIAVYVPQWSSWRLLSLNPPRPIETVTLDGDMLTDLVVDVKRFLSSKEWYLRHSIPYRRGYLLYGPPGNGKTSVVVAVASELGRDIYAITMNHSIADDGLIELLLNVPKNAILLIEDVEQAFKNRSADDDITRVTRSGFLNAVDGVAATTGRILFMTTNFYSDLDEALTRPGRADVAIKIGAPTTRQVVRYLDRFFEPEEVREIIANDGRASMAALQGAVIKRKWGFD